MLYLSNTTRIERKGNKKCRVIKVSSEHHSHVITLRYEMPKDVNNLLTDNFILNQPISLFLKTNKKRLCGLIIEAFTPKCETLNKYLLFFLR